MTIEGLTMFNPFRKRVYKIMNMKAPLYITLTTLVFLLYPWIVQSAEKADFVLVIKNESRLYLIQKDRKFASFRVAFGANPKGHKEHNKETGEPPKGVTFLTPKTPTANTTNLFTFHTPMPRTGKTPGSAASIQVVRS